MSTRRRTSRRQPARRTTTVRRAPSRAGGHHFDFLGIGSAIGDVIEDAVTELGRLSPEQTRGILGVLLALVGIVSIVSIFPSDYAALRDLSYLARGLFGIGWLIALPGMIFVGVALLWSRINLTSWQVLCATIVLFALLGLLSIPAPRLGGWIAFWFTRPLVDHISPGITALLLVVVIGLAAFLGLRDLAKPLLAVVEAGQKVWGERERLNNLRPQRQPAPAPTPRPAPEPAQPAPPAAGPAGPVEQTPLDLESGDDAENVPPMPEDHAFERHLAEVGEANDDTPIETIVGEWDDGSEDVEWDRPDAGSLLTPAVAKSNRMQDEIKRNVRIIEETLKTFGAAGKVVGVNAGPAVTQYEVQPAAGVQVGKIVRLQNDLSLALAASPIRLEVPIPGKQAIGIEVPNKTATLVTLGEVVASPAFQRGNHYLPLAIGNDVAGACVAADLTRMPHLLIAGATGQGKSVAINAMICSLLLQLTPAQLRMVLIDPKRVELQQYTDLPHLVVPVIVEPAQAAGALRWAVAEMERRYKLLHHEGVRNIAVYNERAKVRRARELPHVVIVIDELADLMMVAAGEIEELVCRIAQLARAVGLHLVIATQRPSTDIITGLIKANIPSRIAFAVGSQVDSRVILDSVGAEKLLGRGDMLYLPVDAGKPTRIQGAFVSDPEIEALVNFWKGQGEPSYHEAVLEGFLPATELGPDGERKLDPLFARAARAVAAEGAASVSGVQRKFNVGYSRAGRIIDMLERNRVIGPYQGSKSREVLMSGAEVDELLEQLEVEG
jgi:S-DNA-T family DNA segregation ATPase FtsK/SpoIIIE